MPKRVFASPSRDPLTRKFAVHGHSPAGKWGFPSLSRTRTQGLGPRMVAVHFVCPFERDRDPGNAQPSFGCVEHTSGVVVVIDRLESLGRAFGTMSKDCSVWGSSCRFSHAQFK